MMRYIGLSTFLWVEAVLISRAKRKTPLDGLLRSVGAWTKVGLVQHGTNADLLAIDGDPVAPAARRATGEVLASGVGSIDDGAAGLLLDPAGWPAVDNLNSDTITATAALKLRATLETHGRGGVPALAVATALAARVLLSQKLVR